MTPASTSQPAAHDAAIADVLASLEARGMFHMDFSLGRMQEALRRLGLERPPFATVQVLGTNGKGSTAAFLERLCRNHGLRTGCYASPHFLSPTERIRIDGVPLPTVRLAALAPILDRVAPNLTYFEWLTVCALLAFSEEKVDVAVLEAGLGGRHDATTAIAADLTCYTPIALDHTDVLGTTLAAIAADKADAIRAGTPVLSAAQFPAARDILAAAAARCETSITFTNPLTQSISLRLRGEHQLRNAGLALAAWRTLARHLGVHSSHDAEIHALAAAVLPGRLQPIPADAGIPWLLLDGAHNPHGMKTLTAFLGDAAIAPSCLVYSCLRDKNWRDCLALLTTALPTTPVIVPGLSCPRAAEPETVAAFCSSLAHGKAQVAENVAAAISLAGRIPGNTERSPILVTGSLYLLAEVFALIPGHLVYA